MADKVVPILLQTLKPIKIIKWKVNEGNSVSIGCVFLLYEVDEDDKHVVCKLKSTQAGTVHKLLGQEGDVVKPGEQLLEIQPCTHPTVMRDMCAECGADLRKDDAVTVASVPMVHSVPELKVSLEQAQKIGKADVDRLLKDRKLVLLVDLDQTLIHTTNDNIPANIKDVYHFQLYGPQSPWYHTRLRPGTHRFLENMSPYFELHICTFGARNYAHMIAMFLDQDGKLFSQRILSRDECFNPTSKTANLKALFPCGDDMVCIIDDREDVWSHAANLIHVKPYHFFQHTGDINAPPGLDKHESDEKEGVDLSKVKCDKPNKVKANGLLGKEKNVTENETEENNVNENETEENVTENVNKNNSDVENKILENYVTENKIGENKVLEKNDTDEKMNEETNSTKEKMIDNINNTEENMIEETKNTEKKIIEKIEKIKSTKEKIIEKINNTDEKMIVDINCTEEKIIEKTNNTVEKMIEETNNTEEKNIQKTNNTEEKMIEETNITEEKINEKTNNTEEKMIEETNIIEEKIIKKTNNTEEKMIEETNNTEEKIIEKTNNAEETLIKETNASEGKFIEKTNKTEEIMNEETNSSDDKIIENTNNMEHKISHEHNSEKKKINDEAEIVKPDLLLNNAEDNNSSQHSKFDNENKDNQIVTTDTNLEDEKNKNDDENFELKNDVENKNYANNTQDENNVHNNFKSYSNNEKDNESKEDELIEIEDPDDYLLYLEDILKVIHKTFYEKYDKLEAGKVPDLKKVIPEVRRNILRDTKLVFSGLVPTHIKLEQSKAYQVARSLGATVTQDLEETTTHLVAVRPGTAKVNAGRRKKNLKIVTPDWLWSCAERWTKVDEKLYTLNNKGSKNRHPPPHCSSPEHIANFDNIQDTPLRKRTPSGRFMDTINPLMSFSSADIADMDREVEDIFNESESDGESSKKATDADEVILQKLKKDKESEDESSSSDESLTGEHPHGWRPNENSLKRSREDQDLDDESTADEFPSTKFRRGEELSSDLDIGQESNSEGSVDAPDEIDDGDWNMMGAALEREFLANN